MVKNLPANAGDMGLIPGWSWNVPCATEQLAHAPQLPGLCSRAHELQLLKATALEAVPGATREGTARRNHALQLE